MICIVLVILSAFLDLGNLTLKLHGSINRLFWRFVEISFEIVLDSQNLSMEKLDIVRSDLMYILGVRVEKGLFAVVGKYIVVEGSRPFPWRNQTQSPRNIKHWTVKAARPQYHVS